MKRTVTIVILCFLFVRIFGQVGFLGKRNIISTDLFNTFNQNKFNLNYNFCLGKSFMIKASYSVFSKKTYNSKKEWDYNESVDNGIFYDNYRYDIKNTEVELKGHSWEVGFQWSYYWSTNMAMPLGYYMGLTYEHFSGSSIENCNAICQETGSYYNPINVIKTFSYDNKAGIFKILYGRNSYISYNLLLNLCVEMGYYSGKYTPSDNESGSLKPIMILPISNPVRNNYNQADQDFDQSFGKRTPKLYIMPTVSVGYIF